MIIGSITLLRLLGTTTRRARILLRIGDKGKTQLTIHRQDEM